MNKSFEKPQENVTNAAKNPGILSDIVSFFAIISAYLFVSITYRFDILQRLFGISLRQIEVLLHIYLFYAIIITAFKANSLIKGITKTNKQTQSSQSIEHEIGRSLFTFHFITAFYIVTSAFGAHNSLHFLGHVMIWVIFAQTNQIFCKILGKFQLISTLALFGRTIEIVIILGQTLNILGMKFSDFL